jgi:hypothetical protein
MTKSLAAKIAHALLDPYVSAGMMDNATLDKAATIICQMCEIDRLEKEVAKLQANSASAQ